MKYTNLNTFLTLKTNFLRQIFRITVFSILFITHTFVDAQTHAIEEENYKKARGFLTKNTDSSLYYIKKLKTSKNQFRVFMAKILETRILYDENKYEQCIDSLNSILYEIEKDPRPETFVYSELMVAKTYKECIDIIKLNVYRRFFNLRKNEERLAEAYDYLLLMQKSIDNFPENDFYYLKNKISISYSMASLKRVIGEVKESTDILLEIDKKIDSTPISRGNIWYNDFQKQRANINVQIGRNYVLLGKEDSKLYDLAELHYDKVYKITQAIDSTDNKNKSANYFRKAELNYSRKNYNEALRLANKTIVYSKDKDFNSGLYNIKSRIFSKMKNHDSAIYYSNKLVNSKRVGLKYGFAETYGILAENYYALNKIDSAYKYSQISLKRYNEKNLEKNKTLDVLSNKELSQAISLNQSIENRRKSLKRNITFTVIALLLVVIAILFYSSKRRRLLKQKSDFFKKEFERLQNTHIKKKESIYIIDDETTKRILDDLSKIEQSELFLNPDFNLAQLAKLLKTNTSYLSRIINEHKKLTFKQYLIDLRINVLIKKMDQNPIIRKHSIEALAESIGYTNASSFTRIFKNYTGISPSEYLKKRYTK